MGHYTDDYIRVCKDNQIEPFFSVSLYIDNRNRDKNGCNYNCLAEIGEVCGRLITFAPMNCDDEIVKRKRYYDGLKRVIEIFTAKL